MLWESFASVFPVQGAIINMSRSFGADGFHFGNFTPDRFAADFLDPVKMFFCCTEAAVRTGAAWGQNGEYRVILYQFLQNGEHLGEGAERTAHTKTDIHYNSSISNL